MERWCVCNLQYTGAVEPGVSILNMINMYYVQYKLI